MNILCYRSPYLRRVLASNKKEDNILSHIRLPNISSEIFQIILEYIYGGIISLNEQNTSDILNALLAADELCLQELVDYLQIYLIENKSEWMKENFEFTQRISSQSNNLVELQKFCADFVAKSPERIFKSPHFTSLSEEFLVSLIKRDDIQMKEVEIWEHVLKWGLAQNPSFVADPNVWLDNDFKIMENTLQHCLPFVRLFSLSSKEFSDKVRPYQKLFKRQSYEDLLSSYLDPYYEPGDSISLPRNIEIDGIIDSKIDAILSIVKDTNGALNYHNEHGPCFGKDLLIYTYEDSADIDFDLTEVFTDEYYEKTSNKKKDNVLAHIKFPNMSPEIFQIILRYIYGGILSLDEQETSDFLKVLAAADELQLQELRDDLQMKEIEVWEHVLKWGLAQNSTLISDPDTWSNDDIKTLKNTLQHFLPLMRLYSLSSKEFSQKVRPYKKLLNKQLYEDLLNFYLDSDREPTENISLPRSIGIDGIFDSEIRKDEFTPKKFHTLCDNKCHTVTFIKVKDSEEILGGYNPLKWESSRTWDTNNALNYHSIFGPCFGKDLLMYTSTGSADMDIDVTKIYNEQNYYEKSIREGGNFPMEDYEIFQIIKDK
ncbi:BTB/POZ protein [Rhizophagus irregularis DAOM 181602=DAOM 197198]|nr:BTB/POZ protein [Rhizophagus irregularis DAOM 181602=DAOM 197198]